MLSTSRSRAVFAIGTLLCLGATALWAQTSGGGGEAAAGGHSDPVTPILFDLIALLLAAKLGGAIFLRLGQPSVLGELVAGVVLGNLLLFPGSQPGLEAFVARVLEHGGPIDILARLGVIILLFMVGLESNLRSMMRVGLPSLFVAVIGVVVPFLLGWGVSAWLLPGEGHDPLVFVFIGATLCATSVGITARVLKELNQLHRDESRIVLGAAVIDDVLGLIILAVVSAMIGAKASGTAVGLGSVATLVVVAVGFLVASVVGGIWLAPRVFRLASRLRGEGLLLITALLICFGLAALAGLVGLAPIVGAFAAGLLLDEVHYRSLTDVGETHALEHRIQPLADVMVPIFFVQMGMTVKLSAFAEPGVLGFATLLTLAAIIGKQACGLVVDKRLDRTSIGIAMIPRGEVGLIFAAIGHSMVLNGERVISDLTNAAVVIMVIVTTMITPPALAWSLRHGERKLAAAGHPVRPPYDPSHELDADD